MSATTSTIRLPMPHPGQQTVLRQMRKHNFLCAGRRWRKTTLAMLYMVEHALAAPRHTEFVWSAPTYQQVRRGWTEMKRACAGVVQFNESLMEAHFPTGATVYFVSLTEYDNKRGLTSFGTVIDEASEVPKAAYDEVLRPMLSDTDGWLLAFGTPKGQNWFHTEVQRALAGDSGPHSMAWVTPTLGAYIDGATGELVRQAHPLENTNYRWDALLTEFHDLPERVFRQEYLAEFLTDAGGVFRNVDGIVDGSLKLLDEPTHPVRQYIIGIDLAKTQDFTVCVVADLLDKRIVAFDRWNRADWPLQKARIALMAKVWNNALIYMDTTGLGDPIYDDLRAAGLRIHPYVFTAASKEQLVNHAVVLVEQQQVHTPPITILTNELKSLEYTRSASSGRYRISAPEGLHDDAAMAFCLCCWGLGHGASGNILSSDVLELLRGGISDIRGGNLMGKVF